MQSFINQNSEKSFNLEETPKDKSSPTAQIQNDRQNLTSGEKLNDDSTLSKDNLKHTINVEFLPFSGNRFSLELIPTSTIKEMMDLIESSQSINLSHFRLSHRGKQLEEGRFLQDYDIKEASKIILALKMRFG
jgi:hypothetical protein